MNKNRIGNAFRILVILVAGMVSLCNSAFASEGGHGEGKFNAGEMIMGHVGDAHDWHIATWKGEHITIPLPIIIYDEAKGLSVFMSGKFHHGIVDDRYKLEGNSIVAVDAEGNVDEEASAGLWDLSITKNTAALFVSLILLLVIFFNIAGAYRKRKGAAPKGLQSLIEPIIIFVRDDIAKSSIGEKKYEKFMPYLLTVFFFIWINNLMGLIPIAPFGANLTGSIAVTMTLALITFVITTINGNSHYWRHVLAMPGVPVAILPILTLIEVMGLFLKPFVLMVRLFANITAGHIIVLSFFALIFIFGEKGAAAGFGTGVFSLIFTIFMSMLELLVAFIQAYVFTLLSAIYFSMAVEEEHH